MADKIVTGSPFGGQEGGRRKMTVKAMKRMLKKAGLKTTGKRAALTRRVKKAHLKGGNIIEGGRRRRRRGGDEATGTCTTTGVKQSDCTGTWTADEAPAAAAEESASQGGRRRRGSRRGVFGRLF